MIHDNEISEFLSRQLQVDNYKSISGELLEPFPSTRRFIFSNPMFSRERLSVTLISLLSVRIASLGWLQHSERNRLRLCALVVLVEGKV